MPDMLTDRGVAFAGLTTHAFHSVVHVPRHLLQRLANVRQIVLRLRSLLHGGFGLLTGDPCLFARLRNAACQPIPKGEKSHNRPDDCSDKADICCIGHNIAHPDTAEI